MVLLDENFNTLVCRAVAPIAKLLTWFRPSWESFEQLLMIKGPAWIKERDEAKQKNLLRGVKLRTLASYPFPGTDSQSVVLQARRYR